MKQKQMEGVQERNTFYKAEWLKAVGSAAMALSAGAWALTGVASLASWTAFAGALACWAGEELRQHFNGTH